jgi:hypothetical protein
MYPVRMQGILWRFGRDCLNRMRPERPQDALHPLWGLRALGPEREFEGRALKGTTQATAPQSGSFQFTRRIRGRSRNGCELVLYP